MTRRRIAITGATGFIGGAIVRELARAGHDMQVLVRPQSIKKSALLPNNVKVTRGSLNDKKSLSSLLSNVDTVIHCAGAVRGATESAFISTNATALGDLVEVVGQEPGIERFLLVSSLAASSPEVSPYAASKKAGEELLNSLNSRVSCTIFRPSAVYGPGDTELLPLFKVMKRGFVPIWGTIEQRFSLLYITDFVAAVVNWIAAPNPPSGIYELHDGEPDGYSMKDVTGVAEGVFGRRIRPVAIPAVVLNSLARSNLNLARLIGYAPMLTPWKLRELRYPRWVCDNTEIETALRWEPQIKLARGLTLALATR